MHRIRRLKSPLKCRLSSTRRLCSSTLVGRCLPTARTSLSTQVLPALQRKLFSTATDTEKTIRSCASHSRPCSKRGAEREQLSSQWKEGTEIAVGSNGNKFVVRKVTPIPSYQCTVYELTHSKTGAEYIHIDTADTNNCFGVVLKTVPTDSTGVAHILEHSTLCGSRKYPVRDPFFHMLRRSLNTFMNAMTSADWTCYPFATQNEQDFHNLLSVYCDAVFFPNLNRLDFMQEGHRFEIEAKEDITAKLKGATEDASAPEPGVIDAKIVDKEAEALAAAQEMAQVDFAKSQLVYKGVVYNEMKGNMSDPTEVFSSELRKDLFDQNIYQHNSGGDPAAIPQLTHSQLKKFHAAFYHPSNAVFYSYGDLKPCLEELEEIVLCEFEKSTAAQDVKIEAQPPAKDARNFERYAPEDALVADPYRQTRIAMSWVCNEVDNAEDTFGLSVLSQLLLDGPNAPFYKSLIKSQMGYGFSPVSGYNLDAFQGVFSVGLNNVKDESCHEIEKNILNTLHNCVDEGFATERVQAVLHQFEIEHKQKSGNFGLNLLFRMVSMITHRVKPSPTMALQIDELLMSVQSKVLGGTEPRYFENLIEKYLLNECNQPTVLVMKPDKHYVTKLENTEREQLDFVYSNLSDDAKRSIVDAANELEDYQNSEQDVEVLPTLHVSDIPVVTPDPCVVDELKYTYEVFDDYSDEPFTKDSTLLKTEAITNDISYYKLLYDLKPLFGSSKKDTSRRIEANDYHLILPTYAMCLTQMGAAEYNYEQLSQAMDSKTGGISAQCVAFTPTDRDYFRGDALAEGSSLNYFLEMDAMCLNRNMDAMLHLLEDVLIHPRFDYFDRLEHLLKDKITNEIQMLIEGGHQYAVNHAASAFGSLLPALAVSEKLDGISQVKFCGQLIRALGSQRYAIMKELVELFHAFSEALFRKQGPNRSLLVSDSGFNARNADSAALSQRMMQSFCPVELDGKQRVSTLLAASGEYSDSDSDSEGESDKEVVTESRLWKEGTLLSKLFEESAKIGMEETEGGEAKIRQANLRRKQKEGRAAASDGLKHYFAVPSQVNFCAMTMPTVPFTHESCAALRVAAKLLSQQFLHSEIREKGGAYGSGAAQNKHVFAMYSYRDPRALETVDAYVQGIDWLLSEKVSGRAIDEALLSLFGHIDSPKHPSEKGYQQFAQGIDEAKRQRHREQLLAVDRTAIRQAVDEYLAKALDSKDYSVSIVGKAEFYRELNKRALLEKHGYLVTNLN